MLLTAFIFNVTCQNLTQDTLKTIQLAEVSVSAMRTQINIKDIPQSVSVISNSDILSSPYNNVEDIVRSIPGLYNFRHSNLHTNGMVSPIDMRGVGKNRVLILVDGVPQNDNFNNAAAWVAWGHVPKDAIERLEILRGPSSSLYGSEGLGGVINIITRKAAEDPSASLQVRAGNAMTFGSNGFYSQKFNKFSLLLTGAFEKSDGFYMLKTPEEYEIKRWRNKGQIFGKARYDFSRRSQIELSALYFNQHAGQGRQYFYNELQLDQYTLNYSHLFNNFKIKSLAFLNRANNTFFQDNATDNYTSLFRKEKFRNIYNTGLDIQGTLFAWKPLSITIGTCFKYANFDYNEDYTGSDRDVGALGIQQVISPFSLFDLKFFDEKMLINAGLRYDYIRISRGHNWDTEASAGKPAYDNSYDVIERKSFSPNLGITWHTGDIVTLRASAGKGFKAPSLFELYKVHVRGGGTYYREANPELLPENIMSWDIAGEFNLPGNLFFRLALYRSFANNYIGDRLVNTAVFAGGTKTRYEYILDNISEVNIHGLEIETNWNPLDYFSIKGNYTYNISQVSDDQENLTLKGNYLPNNPRHSANLSFNYIRPEIINVSVGMNLYAKIFFDNENTLEEDKYYTLDMSVSRKFKDMLTVFINAENILNNMYPVFLTPSTGSTFAPGIIINGGIKIEF